MIFVLLCDLLHLVSISRSIHIAANCIISFFLWASLVAQLVKNLVHPHYCKWHYFTFFVAE